MFGHAELLYCKAFTQLKTAKDVGCLIYRRLRKGCQSHVGFLTYIQLHVQIG